jgi:DNA-binding NarL/FixJ family response regulator
MPAASSRASGGTPASPVVVVSDQEMVADTIATALSGLGLAARRGSWPGDAGPVGASPSDVIVLVIESPAPEWAAAVGDLMADGSARGWIVLIPDVRSPEWSAVLAGATLVLPRSSALDDVVAAIRDVAARGELS